MKMKHTIQDGIEGKVCSDCGRWKAISKFHKSRKARDGLQYVCKKCSAAKHKVYCSTEYGRAVCHTAETRYAQSEHGKQTRKEYIKSGAAAKVKRRYHLSDKGKQQRRASAKRARKRYPLRIMAQRAVRNAVQKGYIPSIRDCACTDCSTQAEEYHHESYKEEHWLDVVSLCRCCHRIRHGRIAA